MTNKTKIQTQSAADRITTSLSLIHQRENKQTNKKSAQISPYMKLTQTPGPNLWGQKPKGRKNSTFFKEGNSTFLEAWESESEVAQSCLTLCDPVDCSPPVSSVHGILQARILEWVAISFSRGSEALGKGDLKHNKF